MKKNEKKSANKNFSALTKVNCIITRHKVKSLNMKFKEIQKEKTTTHCEYNNFLFSHSSLTAMRFLGENVGTKNYIKLKKTTYKKKSN